MRGEARKVKNMSATPEMKITSLQKAGMKSGKATLN